MHPLYGALPMLYVMGLVTRGSVISHWYTYSPLSCKTSKYRRTFLYVSVSLWIELGDPVFDRV